MKKFVLSLISLVSLLGLLIVIGAFINTSATQGGTGAVDSSNNGSSPITPANIKATPSTVATSTSANKTRPIGKPAIKPSIKIANTATDKLGYTMEEALAYAQAHPVPSNNAKPPIRVSFEGFKPAKALFWFANTDLPADLYVSEIDFIGSFDIVAANHDGYPADFKWKKSAAPGLTTSNRAYQLYDAQTGNLLIQTVDPQPVNLGSTGVPSITPRIKNAGPTTAAYTADDVIAYNKKHPEGDTDTSKPYWVEKVDFLTPKDLKAKYGRTITSRPDDTVICFVTIRGTFSFPLDQRLKSDVAYQIFDAQTGNLLTEIVPSNNLK